MGLFRFPLSPFFEEVLDFGVVGADLHPPAVEEVVSPQGEALVQRVTADQPADEGMEGGVGLGEGA